MSQIRINSLPTASPAHATDVVAIDGATTRKATLTDAVNAGRPFASQAEAEAGTSATKAMSPLTTAQAIAAIGGAAFAPLAQAVPTGGTTGQVLGKVSDADNDVSWQNAGAGDMRAAIYDPQGKAADAFARANQTGTQLASTISDFSTASDARIAAAVNVTLQPLNADLTAISGIGTTVYGRSLLTLANSTALAGELSGVYQPFDADLTSWAAVTRASGFDAFVATPSSANLKALLTDETGSGAAVFATSPTLVTPNLGTPSAAVLSNATGLPVSTGVSGLGANVATFLATPTSANLATAVPDKTGSGALVFANSPTLVTPVLGAATGTSLQLSGLTASSAIATDAGKNLVSVTNTGTGNNVLATSPTLVTPNLGTPTALVLTNATGLPASTGISGTGATGLSLLAAASTAAAWAIVSAGMAFADTSSVTGVGGAQKFWNPDYFGNPATGIVHRLNRVLVGEATHASSDFPQTTPSWLETLCPGTVVSGQIASVSAIGGLGLVGGARTSDYRAIWSDATGGAEGVVGIGWNDDTGAGTPIATGADFRGLRAALVNGITLGAQISASNEGTTVDITPFGGVVSGSTIANLVTAGPGPAGYTNPISALIVMGGDASTNTRKGIISLAVGFDPALGSGGGGVTYEAYQGQSFRWLNSGDTTDAEFWGNATGLNIATAGGTQFVVAHTASAVNHLQATGSIAGNAFGPTLFAAGSDTAVPISYSTKGLAEHFFLVNSLIAYRIAGVASAVNWLSMTNSITGVAPKLSAAGVDTNVGFDYATQGTGVHSFYTNGTAKQVEIAHVASSVNWLELRGGAAAGSVSIRASGSNTDIPMILLAKGAGSIFFRNQGVNSFQIDSPASSVNRLAVIAAVTAGSPKLYTSGSDTNISGSLQGSGTGGWKFLDGGSATKFEYNTTGLGFHGTAPVAKPTITGAKGGNAALTSLLTQLASTGLITDSTT